MADFATWVPVKAKGEYELKTFEVHLKPQDRIEELRPRYVHSDLQIINMLKNWPVYRVFKREMLRLARLKSARNLFIIIPLVVFLLLGSIYYKGALREVPVAVYDNDNSTLSRTYIRFLESSPNLKVTHYLSSSDAIENAFVEKGVQGCVLYP